MVNHWVVVCIAGKLFASCCEKLYRGNCWDNAEESCIALHEHLLSLRG